MFPYYPFKQLLIAQYIQNFENVYAAEQIKGMSIGCQIMTSYKLIEDYADLEGAKPFYIKASNNIGQVHHLTKMLTY